MIDPARLRTAYEKARDDLLAERCAEGHWVGELSTSALSTATAVSALALVKQHCHAYGREPIQRLIDGGVRWLAAHQNEDGGWGDTDKSYSNIATTMLVRAAFHLAGVADEYAAMIERAERYIDAKDGIDGLRKRYGKDKTFAVPILTNCALAGLVDWSEVAPLPFEAAAVPQRFYRFLQLPVVSYAIPALVAIGQARYFHKKPWNPIARWLRAATIRPSLKVLHRMQPESGGYLEAVPLTSFVVMSLAATGRALHPVTENGINFLMSSVRQDGSWPIDTNLATWNTTLSINALANGEEDVVEVLQHPSGFKQPGSLIWLLSCQHNEPHPFTGAEPGGWGWSDLSGAVPDADDTPGALLTLAHWHDSSSCSDENRHRIREAAAEGIDWLLRLQNRDDGWPTFCRGWGKLPFDRSGADLTAHALRALNAWKRILTNSHDRANAIDRAYQRGFAFLAKNQRADGSWIPLWFGNQDHPSEENPVYGTAKVLLAYLESDSRSLIDDEHNSQVVRRGLTWLRLAQNADGGWGGSGAAESLETDDRGRNSGLSSVEETALAVEALIAADNRSPESTRKPQSAIRNERRAAAVEGLDWLVRAVETNQHWETSPIGFYFAKLWYYERLYPMIFTVSALGRAIRQTSRQRTELKPTTARLADI